MRGCDRCSAGPSTAKGSTALRLSLYSPAERFSSNPTETKALAKSRSIFCVLYVLCVEFQVLYDVFRRGSFFLIRFTVIFPIFLHVFQFSLLSKIKSN